MRASVLIVQHGEKVPRPGDPGLTPRGYRQAERVAAALAGHGPVKIVASPLRRARETAEPLARRCDLPVETDPRLRERLNLEVGEDPTQFGERWRMSTLRRTWTPPGGRSSITTGADLRQALRDHVVAGQLIVVVGHGGATVDLVRDLLGDGGLDDRAPGLLQRGVPAAAATRLELTEEGWRVLRIAEPADE